MGRSGAKKRMRDTPMIWLDFTCLRANDSRGVDLLIGHSRKRKT
jgi:hypothetical protein